MTLSRNSIYRCKYPEKHDASTLEAGLRTPNDNSNSQASPKQAAQKMLPSSLGRTTTAPASSMGPNNNNNNNDDDDYGPTRKEEEKQATETQNFPAEAEVPLTEGVTGVSNEACTEGVTTALDSLNSNLRLEEGATDNAALGEILQPMEISKVERNGQDNPTTVESDAKPPPGTEMNDVQMQEASSPAAVGEEGKPQDSTMYALQTKTTEKEITKTATESDNAYPAAATTAATTTVDDIEGMVHLLAATLRFLAAVNDALTAVGFGKLDSNADSTSTTLQEVEIYYVSDDICLDQYGVTDFVSQLMFCSGVPGGGKDTCQGDSGGPIIHQATNTQVGAVSFGIGCAAPEYSGVNSRVSSVVDWIDDMICELSDYPPPRCNGNGGSSNNNNNNNNNSGNNNNNNNNNSNLPSGPSIFLASSRASPSSPSSSLLPFVMIKF